MDGRKEEKKQIEPIIPHTPFYTWLIYQGALTIIEEATGNKESEDTSDLAPDLESSMMSSQNKRKSDADKKQTPPVSPKFPKRRPPNNNSPSFNPLLFPCSKGRNLDSLPSGNPLSKDDSLTPRGQWLLDALLEELKGNPMHSLIAEKAISQQRMLDQQQLLRKQ